MASDWLAAVLAANRKAGLKIDVNYHRFYRGIALVTQTPGHSQLAHEGEFYGLKILDNFLHAYLAF